MYSHHLLTRCIFHKYKFRNKIVDILELYEVDTIRTALPTYYSELKPSINTISSKIASYRNKKGTASSTSEETLDSFLAYKQDVLLLKQMYQKIAEAQKEMEEIQAKEEKRTKAENRKNLLLGGIIGVIGSALVSLIFYLIGA